MWNLLSRREDAQLKATTALTQTLKELNMHLERLTEEVAKNRDVTASAVSVLQALVVELQEHFNEPEKVKELADNLAANTDALAAAIASVPPLPSA